MCFRKGFCQKTGHQDEKHESLHVPSTLRMEGGGRESLSLKTQETSKIPGSDGLLASRLSRDGRYMTAHRPNNKTMLYDFQSQQWSDFGEGIPAWSHDSKFVYFHRKNGAQSAEVVRIRVPNGKVERVLDLKGTTLGGYWPDWVSLLPDDSPLLMLDKSTQEIYRLEFQRH